MRVVCVIYFPTCVCRRAALEAKKRQTMREPPPLKSWSEKKTHFEIHQIDSDALDKLLNYYSTRTSDGNAFCELEREMRDVGVGGVVHAAAGRLRGQWNYSPFLSVSLQRLQCIAVLCLLFHICLCNFHQAPGRADALSRLASLWMRTGANGNMHSSLNAFYDLCSYAAFSK
jgi:hypothetical protein